MPYYRVINGVKHDHRILRAAETVAAQPCTQTPCGRALPIDAERVLPIVAAATDGKRVTDVERRTIKRVLDTYTFTTDAKAELVALLTPGGDEDEDGAYATRCHGREPDPPFYQCRAF